MIDQPTEDYVLSVFLAHPDQAGAYLAQKVKPEHFGLPGNGKLYSTLLAMFAEGTEIAFMTVVNRLKEQKCLELVGGPTRLTELLGSAGPVRGLGPIIETLKESHRKRQIRVLLDEVGSMVQNGSKAALGALVERAEGILAESSDKTHPSTKELVMEAIKRIQERSEGKNLGISTGIKSLDDSTGGLRRGSQWVIAGPAKGGKSSLAITLMRSMSVKQKQRCAFYGLEMPSLENIERLLCCHGNASSMHLRDGMLSNSDMEAIARGAVDVAPAPIHFRDDIFDLPELIGNIKTLSMTHPDLFAVFVDYAQLLTIGTDENNREREVAIISRTIRQIGLKHNLCMILLSQLNDDGKLRESRALGMDATKIVMIEHAEDPAERKLRLIQRDGPADSIKVSYRGDRFLFADLENRQSENRY